MGFGMIMDKNGEKFKTRSGETVKLQELLDEAKTRALAVLHEKFETQLGSGEISNEQLEEMSEKIGINSIKYYDLKFN